MAGQGSKRVQATVNSFRILERLVVAEGSMGVTELANEVGLSKGVVYNHLSTLVSLGYVTKRERSYLASFELLALGDKTRNRLPQFERVARRVDNLAQVTGEVSTMLVEEDGVGICVYIALGRHPWTPDYTCGSRMPLHVNALGKAILTSLDRSRVDEILDEHGLASPTNETVTNRNALYSELGNISESGVVFCREEQFTGVVGAAAPVSLGERAPAAAVGVCGPSERLTGRRYEEDVAGQVLSTAKSINADMTG